MSKRPWYPLYTGDLRRKTEHLSAEELGCYMRLMNNYWDNGGPITADPSRLCRIMGIEKRKYMGVMSQIGSFFVHHDSEFGDALLLPRMEEEIGKAIDLSEKRSQAGRKGGQANAKQVLEQLPTHSHSQLKERAKKKILKEKKPAKPKPRKGQFKHKSVPVDWIEDARERPRYFSLNLENEAEAFFNHHKSKGSQFSCWKSAWWTWLGNALKFQQPRVKTANDFQDELSKLADQARAQA